MGVLGQRLEIVVGPSEVADVDESLLTEIPKRYRDIFISDPYDQSGEAVEYEKEYTSIRNHYVQIVKENRERMAAEEKLKKYPNLTLWFPKTTGTAGYQK